MKTEAISLIHKKRTPALAAAVVFCLSLTPDTLASATSTSGQLHTTGIAATELQHKNGEVLTEEDAALYRGIFDAQNHAAWQDADAMAARLSDKRLMGHVLADRYRQHPPTLQQAEAWLAAYRDLPEAAAIHQQARKLPGAKNTKLALPVPSSSYSGGGFGYATGSGFHHTDRTRAELSAAGRRAVSRIETAMRQGMPDRAKTLLESSLQQGLLTEEALAPLQSRLAAGFFYSGDADQALRLTEAGYMQDDARAEWIKGLSYFQLRHYANAADAFTALANDNDLTDSDHAAAAFWTYRALKQAGDNAEAAHWLAETARTPHNFYGMLAGNLNGQNAESGWSWHMPEFGHRAYDALASLSGGARAMALVQIGQNDLAESELRRINPQGRRALLEAMLALAEKGHMAGLALKLGGLTTDDDGNAYDAALYPVPSWQPKEGFRVDRALIYALMRHESHFNPMAVSSQGACGLMQLMPATARLMSGHTSSHGTNSTCPDQFFDPVTNIGLGQNYVRRLADQPMIGDNLLLLLTAYNAGPGRLMERNGIADHDDPLLFMESLPSQETHDYVQAVLMQYWSYRARLNLPLQSLTQLAHGQWPRFALRDTGTREAALALPANSFAVADNVTVH